MRITEVQRLAARLKDWLDNGVPTACKEPPWGWGSKILRLTKKGDKT